VREKSNEVAMTRGTGPRGCRAAEQRDESDRVIVVIAIVVRRIGYLAHLKDYVFVEHPPTRNLRLHKQSGGRLAVKPPSLQSDAVRENHRCAE
jgi:hypothetical protein